MTRPPDQNAKRQITPLLLLVAADLAGFGMVLADIQLRAEHEHAEGWLIGLILSSMFVVQVFASPIWGRMADRWGRKPIVVICTILSAASMGVYAISNSIPLLILSRVLAGFAAANVSVVQAWIGDELQGAERTAAMGKIGAAVTAGLVVGPALGGFLAQLGGNALVGVTAASFAIAGIIGVLFAREEAHEGRADQQRSAKASLFSIPGLPSLMLLAAIAWFSLACLEGTFARLLEHRWNQHQAAFGLVFAFESAIGFLVQGWLVPRVSGRLGDQGLVKLGLLLQGVGLASMPFFPVFGLVFIGSAVYSVGSSLFGPGLNAWCSDITPAESQATMFGTLQASRSFGFIVGPILGGALFDVSNASPYVLAGVVCIFGSAVAARIAQKGRAFAN